MKCGAVRVGGGVGKVVGRQAGKGGQTPSAFTVPTAGMPFAK